MIAEIAERARGSAPGPLGATRRAHAALTALALAAATIALYARHLGSAPIYLATDEVTIGLTAHSIATTGRDLAGRPWPLYIQMTAGSWFCPAAVYSTAIVLKVLPLSEFAIRLTTVLVGAVDVVLMYFAGLALFRRQWTAVLAAALLALTPAHFLHSRVALEYLYPLPFIIGWLACLFAYLDTDRLLLLGAGTLILGLGFFSYLAAVIVMPMYVALTCLALLVWQKPARAWAVAVGAFLAPILVLFVPWLIAHRGAYGNTVGHYLVYDTSRLNPLQGVREFLNPTNVAERTSQYWGYLNPSFLFLDAVAPIMNSTRAAGVFLAPLAVFVPIGLYRALRGVDRRDMVLFLGFVTAPLAATVVDEPGSINRALELLPFGVLLGSVGVVHLWDAARLAHRRPVCLGAGAAGIALAVIYAAWTLATQGRVGQSTLLLLAASAAMAVMGALAERAAWRLAAIALLALVPPQFHHYYNDYMHDYRARSSPTFRLNRRAALEHIIEESGRREVPAVYFSGSIEGLDPYWRFYLAKHRREDLLSRTRLFDRTQPLRIDTVPAGSELMAPFGDPTTESLAAEGKLTLETLATEPGGRPSFAVYRR